MKEALVTADPKTQSLSVSIVETPVPSPSPTQLVIKVIFSGSNPKDWKVPLWLATHNGTNSGDDIAGIVHAVGSAVTEFKAGDRVAAFHEMRTPGGSFAEYAVAEEHTTFHLPPGVGYEAGAAIPLAAMTAAVGLFVNLAVPEPWVRNGELRERVKGGVAVYGAASAVGAYVVKLLRRAGAHPIIAVAGRGREFVETLIDRNEGDTIVDYRTGDEEVVKALKDGIRKGEKLYHAFDAVTNHGSYDNLAKVLAPGGYLTTVLPGKDLGSLPKEINHVGTMVGTAHGENKDFAYAWFRLFGQGLKDGWFSAHPTETIPGGLGGIQKGLENLRDGKASAVKYVFDISATEGVGKSIA